MDHPQIKEAIEPAEVILTPALNGFYGISLVVLEEESIERESLS
jgi:hypothetical protein